MAAANRGLLSPDRPADAVPVTGRQTSRLARMAVGDGLVPSRAESPRRDRARATTRDRPYEPARRGWDLSGPCRITASRPASGDRAPFGRVRVAPTKPRRRFALPSNAQRQSDGAQERRRKPATMIAFHSTERPREPRMSDSPLPVGDPAALGFDPGPPSPNRARDAGVCRRSTRSEPRHARRPPRSDRPPARLRRPGPGRRRARRTRYVVPHVFEYQAHRRRSDDGAVRTRRADPGRLGRPDTCPSGRISRCAGPTSR